MIHQALINTQTTRCVSSHFLSSPLAHLSRSENPRSPKMDVVLSHVEQSNNKSVQNALFKIRIQSFFLFLTPQLSLLCLVFSVFLLFRLHLCLHRFRIASIYPFILIPSFHLQAQFIPSFLRPNSPDSPPSPFDFYVKGTREAEIWLVFFFIFFSQILSCRRRTKEARRPRRHESCRGDGTHLFTLQTSELTFNHLQVRTIFSPNTPRIHHLAPISGLLSSGSQTALMVKPARLRPFSRKSRGLDTL